MRTRLLLEDGERLEGESFGFQGETTGEVVFSTGMTGYVESLTDPSFAGQILVFTYPLIGNYGVPKPRMLAPHLVANMESEQIWVRGVVVGTETKTPSHFDAWKSFDAWLNMHHIPGISGVDTRRLTQTIREKGTLRGIISATKKRFVWEEKPIHWVSKTSIAKPLVYKPKGRPIKHIALIDCGVKHGILRSLLAEGYQVTRIPWNGDPMSIPNIDGVVGSNGPGDPKDCKETIANIRRVVSAGVPFLGICLGHQLLALAVGADTYKLPYGHRGLNQPCQDVITKKTYITSQNHGYAVKPDSIPSSFREWFNNLNDGTNEGLRAKNNKAWSVQFHPEGHPGPFDTKWLFRAFHSHI